MRDLNWYPVIRTPIKNLYKENVLDRIQNKAINKLIKLILNSVYGVKAYGRFS